MNSGLIWYKNVETINNYIAVENKNIYIYIYYFPNIFLVLSKLCKTYTYQMEDSAYNSIFYTPEKMLYLVPILSYF